MKIMAMRNALKCQNNGSRVLILFVFCLFGSLSSFGQDILYSWTKHIENQTFGTVTSITSDHEGAIYSIGSFSDTVDFDPGPNVLNLISKGGLDIFVQKMDLDGNLLWAKSFGSSAMYENALGLSLNSNGDLHITGRFKNTIDFDPGPNVVNKTSNGDFDVFILKLTNSGDFVWVKTIGGSDYDNAKAIITDSIGNSYVLGEFVGQVDLDTGIGTEYVTSLGFNDVFISKLDTSGNTIWTKVIGGEHFDNGYSIALSPTEDVYISGSFSDTVDFDPGIGVTELSATYGIDNNFLLKLTTEGTFEWVIRVLNSGNGQAYINSSKIQIDDSGNIYIPGYCDSEVDVDPGVGEYWVEPLGTRSSFIQKLNSSGGFEWVRVFEGSDFVSIMEIYLDEYNNIYSTGSFFGTADFDPGVGEVNYVSTGLDNLFVQKMDALGNFEWATYAVGELNFNRGNVITTDEFNNVFVSGSFEGVVDFNPDSESDVLTPIGEKDIFIQKLTQCFTYTIDTVEACDDYVWIDGATYTSNDTTTLYYLTDIQGCDSVIQLHLTMHSIDTTLLFVGYTLTANESEGTYQWLNCDSGYNTISGEINQSFTPFQNGNYAVEIIKGMCIDTSNCVSVHPISITENNKTIDVVISPNPTNGQVFISNRKLEDVQINIYNALGQMELRKELKALNQLELTLPEAKGLYFINIIGSKQHKTYKLIKY